MQLLGWFPGFEIEVLVFGIFHVLARLDHEGDLVLVFESLLASLTPSVKDNSTISREVDLLRKSDLLALGTEHWQPMGDHKPSVGKR